MIYYLLIGVFFTMMSDYLTKALGNEELFLTNTERLILIFVWPIGFLILIWGLIKNL